LLAGCLRRVLTRRSGVDEASAVIEVGTKFEGYVENIAFGVAEAETESPNGLLRLFVQIGDGVELTDC
jgi:hypothetical protein